MPTAAATPLPASLLAFAAALVIALSGCSSTGTAVPRQNFLRVKGGETPTEGYMVMRRLDEAAPSLKPFLTRQGDPDFLFVTQDDDRTYLFLYYVAKNQAYAVRGPSHSEGPVEYSGPQEIDAKERALFKALMDLEE